MTSSISASPTSALAFASILCPLRMSETVSARYVTAWLAVIGLRVQPRSQWCMMGGCVA